MQSCPACGARKKLQFYYGDHLALQWSRRLKWRIIQKFRYLLSLFIKDLDQRLLFSPHQKIYCCEACGYGRVTGPLFSETALKHYYQSKYWLSDGSGVDNRPYLSQELDQDDRAAGQVEFIRPFLTKTEGLSVLEIGAATAMFSRVLKSYIPDVKLNVVESGNAWISYYHDLGINKISDYYPIRNGREKFDVISGSHWLEHALPEIGGVIESLKKDLAPNGLLFLEVPNCESAYWKSDFGDIPHTHFFTVTGMVKLFEQYGFHSLRVGIFGETFDEQLKKLQLPPGDGVGRNSLSLEAKNSIRRSVDREKGTVIRSLFCLN